MRVVGGEKRKIQEIRVLQQTQILQFLLVIISKQCNNVLKGKNVLQSDNVLQGKNVLQSNNVLQVKNVLQASNVL